MPERSLLHGGVPRWLSAGVIVATAGAMIVSHVMLTENRRDSLVAVLFEGGQSELARSLFEGKGGLAIKLSAAQRTKLVRELAHHPLDGTAIALLALAQEASGDSARALLLADQALKVEPRTRLAWLARLDRQMRQRRNVDAANSALRLLSVDPKQFATYLPILATLTRDRRTLPLIAAALRPVPIWRTPFLSLLSEQQFDPAIRYALMNPAFGAAGVTVEVDHTAFVNDLVARGDFDRAYLAWLSFLPDVALRGVGTPYDAGFDGLPGPPPFNWLLSTVEADRASIEEGVLDISYSGRRGAELASQVVIVPAGTYRMATTIADANDGGARANGTGLTWRIACLPQRTVIAEIPLNLSLLRRGQQSPPFAVPADGCGAVSLSLVGTASEFPARLNARIDSVAFGPAQASTNTSSVPAAGAAAQPATGNVTLP